MWLRAPNLQAVHGFSTRRGGVSPKPFDSLNLGGSADEPHHIKTNREIALRELGLDPASLITLKQVHSATVCVARAGARQEGDALVSNDPQLTLGILVADCYPVLFCDAQHGVIGAAHCGWRGTVAMLASQTFHTMSALGAEPQTTRVAIGQGISAKNFRVGEEVTQQFRDAGFPSEFLQNSTIDLPQCILFTLKAAGIPEENIHLLNRCTFEDDFFSHRRDKGKTGRMLGVISLKQ